MLGGGRSFDRVAFERVVEGVRAKVSALLWQLVVVWVRDGSPF